MALKTKKLEKSSGSIWLLMASLQITFGRLDHCACKKNKNYFRQTHCWFIEVLWAKFCVVRLNKAKIVQKFEFAPNRSKLAHKTSGATYARVERGRNFFFVRISPQRSPGPIQMKFGTFGHFGTERIGPMTQTRSVKCFFNFSEIACFLTSFIFSYS